DGDVWLFASQPLGVKTIITVARVVCDAALARGGVTVLIKMHPNETSPYRQAYDELARTYNIEILVNQEAKSPIAIVASDAVFTHFSSVAIEAHAMQKPAIAVNPFGKPLPFDLDSSGIAPEISSPEEIVPTLKRLAANESAVDVLRDGRALERAREIIANQLRNGKQKPKERQGSIMRCYSELLLSYRRPLSPIARPLRKLLDL
ncbi:hypothetical protein, partial [Fulvimarina pelagi]|uniref:hypothetical protein n=1 Tax=Fulvimarina pelagi TaxID=217511 RepID=UPI00058EFB2C